MTRLAVSALVLAVAACSRSERAQSRAPDTLGAPSTSAAPEGEFAGLTFVDSLAAAVALGDVTEAAVVSRLGPPMRRRARPDSTTAEADSIVKLVYPGTTYTLYAAARFAGTAYVYNIYTTDSARGRANGVGIGSTLKVVLGRLGSACRSTTTATGNVLVTCDAGWPEDGGTIELSVRESLVVAIAWHPNIP